MVQVRLTDFGTLHSFTFVSNVWNLRVTACVHRHTKVSAVRYYIEPVQESN